MAIGIIFPSESEPSVPASAGVTETQNQEPDPTPTTSTTPEPTPTPPIVTLDPEFLREEYIGMAKEIPYKDLARSPEKYEGEIIAITVEVQQIMDGNLYRAYEDYEFTLEDSSTYLKKEWLIDYEIPAGSPRILEEDVVIFYGEFYGLEAISRALTQTTDYIPRLEAKYCEILSD
jgi:hypothetical protein